MANPDDDGRTGDGWARRSYLGAVGTGALSLGGIGQAATTTSGASFREDAPPEADYPNVYRGETATLGNGEVGTFVGTDEADDPVAVGVWFDAGVLTGLPDEHTETILAFPDEVEALQFTFFMLNWNPHGHEPPGIYDLPHFDFHYYFVDEGPAHLDQIRAGSCDEAPVPVAVTCETFERATRPLPDDQRPPDYQDFGAVVPRMGNHLTDPSALEFTGATFTHTMIWGAFDGRLTFIEPMITNALFETLDCAIRTPIKMPRAFPNAGSYPTQYAIDSYPDDDAYAVTLDTFEQFGGSMG